MAEYSVEVRTGDMRHAGTLDHVSVTLIGTEGQSEETDLDKWGRDFSTGATTTYPLKTASSLGRLLLVRVDKDPRRLLREDLWYCRSIRVWTPERAILLFPCHRWISRGERVELRVASATKVFEEDHPILREHRHRELTEKRNLYQWKVFHEGLPFISHFEKEEDVPTEMQRSNSKKSELSHSKRSIRVDTYLCDLDACGQFLWRKWDRTEAERSAWAEKRWEKLEDLKKIFWLKRTALSDYVADHWRDDDFYGAQFLNGINPNVICRCSELPCNFPVSDKMVESFLDKGCCLKSEMEKGNVFLYDQRKMEGILTRTYNGAPLHVTPGFCLLHLNSDKVLKPIAIQLYQKPLENNPIFLPSDSETDWLLAKMYMKNADVLDHQAVHHLLNTHLLAEVYLISMLRNLPAVHPVYKLLVPHFHGTLPINIVLRQLLLGPKSAFETSSLGCEGVVELMRRSLSEMTYSALCLPDNIRARGLDSVPNFYYRDDGLKLWAIINSFVHAVLEHYYPSDAEVQRDSELQDWIRKIFTHGILGNRASGFPQSFTSVQELVQFITMVIFTSSAQHSAVSSGQFDYLSWIPNSSLLLLSSPPSIKGQSDMQSVLDALPNIGDTVMMASLAWRLSTDFSDMVQLGSYPEQHFDDPAVERMIKEFQAELSFLSEAINERNSKLKVPYTYLLPSDMENSITI